MVNIDTSFDFALPNSIKLSLYKTALQLKALGSKDFINKPLSAPSKHLVSSGGKYIRPTIVFLSALAIGEKPGDYVNLASAIELLHTASLVHDDIIDRDRIRRGLPAVHIKYGTEAAILAGDALISKSILLSSGYGRDVIDSISRAAMSMCAGEILDFGFQKSQRVPDVNSYTEIASLKSASLIATAASVAAISANKPKLASRLYEFGKFAGIAFQMRDDLFNFMGLNDSSKKSTGNDGAKFRPNIVDVVLKTVARREDAIEKVIALNNSFIDKANKNLKGTVAAETLSKYANLIRIRTAG